MILSVGYGKDADGRMIANFGPLGQEKGERRLNVAATRARWKTIVVSIIRATDIPVTALSTGAQRLRDYLDYAERGAPALDGKIQVAGGTAATSAFEGAVLAALQARGLT